MSNNTDSNNKDNDNDNNNDNENNNSHNQKRNGIIIVVTELANTITRITTNHH